MNEMVDLFKERRVKHFAQMLKYLRFVLNDHFLLACLFMLGGVGLYYSEILKTLPPDFFPGKIIIVLTFAFYLSFGRVATLVKEADKVFLLPKETKMNDYLRKALGYSLIFPTIVGILLVGFLVPLMFISLQATWLSFICFGLTIFLLKRVDLIIQSLSFMQKSSEIFNKPYLVMLASLFSRLIIFAIAVFISPIIMFFIGALLALFVELYFRKLLVQIAFDWDKLIEKEKIRVHNIYRFFSLFTDVPEITSKVKRRKYLDGVLAKIKPKHKNTFLYLYWRTFLRGTEYSGLVLRLGILGVLILIFANHNPVVVLALSVLFFYMIGFQLLPMYLAYDYMLMTKLYPVSIKDKQKSLALVLTSVLTVIVLIFTITAVIIFPKKKYALFLAVLLVIEEILLTKVYLPYRLRKN